MTVQTIKRMLDACYQAKRIREMLPALPSGVTPSYIHFLDVIQIMERQGVAVKISDISDYLNIPRPGVTRTVKEMEEKGYLRKANAAEDGRITYISLTEEGRKLSENIMRIICRSGTVSGEHFRSRCESDDTDHRDLLSGDVREEREV